MASPQQNLRGIRHIRSREWRACYIVVAALAACVPRLSPIHAATVYYVNQPEGGLGRINAVKPDGTGHTTLHTTTTVTDLRGIAVDPIGGRIIYAHATTTTGTRTDVSIRSLAPAGGVPVILRSYPDGTFIADVEWDEVGNKIYYSQPGGQLLMRMNGDGSELVMAVATNADAPNFFALDLVGSMAYWGMGTNPGDVNSFYSRGSLVTGTVDPDFILYTNTRTRDIAVDNTVGSPRLYWCDRQDGAVYERLANGGIVSIARFGLNAPHGLVIDVEAGKGYVADTGKRGSGLQPSAHRVVRFNLDGSGPLEFLSPMDSLAEPWDLAIDLTTSSYADWKTRFFSSTAQNSDPSADADSDGWSNMAEYAFFTHPERVDSKPPAVAATNGGFHYARRLVTDLIYRVEVSKDLQTWHWNGDTPGAIWTVETSTEPRDLESQWVNVAAAPVLSGESRLFFRLRAQLPAEAAGKPQAAATNKKSIRKRAR